ncbi:MAG TPA: hypothetical protein VD929_02260 [Caulobacteraceae bacterium]|nr:hypothetical protein [Caulobacteraceae bacterium]
MIAVSQTDRLVAILRQRLSERGGARPAKAKADGRRSAGVDLQALAALESVDDRQLGRALIQNVLAEHFGPELVNEAKFQQVVDQVTGAVDDDPQGRALMHKVVGELRAAAR